MNDETVPWSEQYRAAAEEYADKESAAQLLEDLKSVVMAQKQTAMGDIPVNRAEQSVKASPQWQEYVESCVAARKEANMAKAQCEYLRMKFQEFQSKEANARAEIRLTT